MGNSSLSSVETQPNTAYQTILFDLDGTLVDQFRAIYDAYAHTMEQMNLPPVTYQTVRSAVGGSITITFGKLVPADKVDQAVAIFREKFGQIWDSQIDVLPGVVPLLQALTESGHQLAVFTNKDGHLARKVVEKAGLADYFAAVFGTLDTPWKKPEREFTEHVLTQLGASPAQTCMIGDSPYDAAAAASGHLDCFTVATGSHTIAQLAEECPNAPAFPSMAELAAKVFNVNLSKRDFMAAN